MPFYVPPEQQMKDRADYARRNIARGRPVIVLGYDNGIAFVAENASRSLHKISEIYDRIAFAAAGRYNEFENLRVAGVRYADLRGYSYDRSDVTARGLANAYAQILGNVFTQDSKPMEVELAVAQVGETPETDQIYRLTYDGSVADEQGFVVMGGQADAIATGMQERWRPGLTLSAALTLAVEMLSRDSGNGSGGNGTDTPGGRTLTSDRLEVAVLDRARPRRAFRRLGGQLLEALLAPDDPTTDVPSSDDSRPGKHDTLTGEQAPETPVPPAPAPGDPVSSEPDQQPGHPEGEGA
ncbi:proteasome subunit alpha [Kineosporia succinea]